MWLDHDLLPLAARAALERIPSDLRAELLSAEGRRVMRDWAREHDLPVLADALAPPAFFHHAAIVVVERFVHSALPAFAMAVEAPWWDEELLVIFDRKLTGDTWEELDRASDKLLAELGDNFDRLGLRTTGRDDIVRMTAPPPRLYRRATGWAPVTGWSDR